MSVGVISGYMIKKCQVRVYVFSALIKLEYKHMLLSSRA